MYINCTAHAYCYEEEMQEMEMCHFNKPVLLAKAGKWVVLVVMVGFVLLSVLGDGKWCI